MGPGAQWLVDNFYLLRDQRNETLRHLRSRFFRTLPHLVSGPYTGFPRVYHVAVALLEAVDHAVDAECLEQFLRAYQTECPLTLAELWAVPDMLRVALLADLPEIALHILDAHRARERAREWAALIRVAGASDPIEGAWEARRLADSERPLPDTLIQALLEQLQGDPGASLVVEWLERQLALRGTSVSDLARQAIQRQVSVSHAVSALRWTASARWERIVESVSLTEAVLREDPAGVYPRMDAGTRDRYRHAVEDFARQARASEIEVARAAIDRCEQAEGDAAARHVGYHLIGPGRVAMAASVGSRPTLAQRIARWGGRHPLLVYLFSVASITAGAELAILRVAEVRGVSMGLLALVLATAFLPCLELAIAFTNRLVAWALPPRRLPKLDAEAGLSTDDRTLVVVPALLHNAEAAVALVEAIEVHAYANPSPLLRFALLSDFDDSVEASTAEDEGVLSAARNAIRRLNDRHRDAWGDRFFLLHRERVWNPAEGVWMGWERKRGKIEELNALLLGSGQPTTITEIEGGFADVCGGGGIRYVITLDADTRMPPSTALDLVRTAAHPLNRPQHDPRTGRVIDGYAILQPRISIAPRSAARSRFARIFSGLVGLDPYTTAVSDVYQDLFGEGIYTGKGLYDVKAFSHALEGVIPENAVLSHDLLESTFARAALVTDIELYDDYPGGFLPYVKRLHRWVRGDWQIIPWLFGRPRGRDGSRRDNPISALGRWQIFDNIRRSVTGPAMLLFLFAGWIALPRSPLFWSVVALAILAFPIYVNLTAAVLARPLAATWVSYLKGVIRDLRRNLVQTGVMITFLAASAFHTADAIARALWRMTVSKRRMLEWQSAHEVERRGSNTLAAHWRSMWPSTAWGLAAFCLVTSVEPRAGIAAAPFVSAWIAAPVVAWWLSLPTTKRAEQLSLADQRWLRQVGRTTWSYFERHVGPQTCWLPPDNVQEDPFRGVAARTSPTNIGLGLVATQCAIDFGWMGHDQGLARLERAAESIDGLDSHHGHLYNWYDTQAGRTLWPRYVSTVDSGNFVAALIVLEQALRSEGSEEWPSPAWARGLRDSIELFRGRLDADAAGPAPRLGEDLRSALHEVVAQLEQLAHQADSTDLNGWLRVLAQVGEVLDRPEWAELGPASDHDLDSPVAVLDHLRTVVAGQRSELMDLLPWWRADEPIPEFVAGAGSLDGLLARLSQARADDLHAAQARDALRERQRRRIRLADWCAAKVRNTDFSILYDHDRDLFSIGLDADTFQLDASHYDLLASEARVASFIAIALGQVPVVHWFRLGRKATETADGAVLLSWGGTAFEVLMPLLIMPTWPDTLLDESYRTTVLAQIRYGERRGRPWGISESAYNTLSLDLDYQYRGFGVPGLGLKSGLGKDYVVAPYATMLAAMVLPSQAVANLKRIAAAGGYGAYGYYDAIDYTASRLMPGSERAVVKSWMAHHQAMSVLAISNVLDGARMRRRFRAAPLVESAELLVQERVPIRVETIDPHPMQPTREPVVAAAVPAPVVHASSSSLNAPSPRGGVLSNGDYRTVLTQAGTGGSWYRDWQLTRWTPDRVCDPSGVFFYLRDLDSGRTWSVGPAPIGLPADRSDTWFHLGKIESALVHDWIETFVEVCVSPEEDVEVRRLTITNYGSTTRHLDLTSYAEIVLNSEAADRAHPAFSKLFLQTEAWPEHQTLAATRRPRERGEESIWLFQTLISDPTQHAVPSFEEYETDRERFLGRGRTRIDPTALDAGAVLSGSVGPVLDPVFAIRQPLTLKPQAKTVVSFVMGVAATRSEAVAMADRYDHPMAVKRVIDLAAASGPVEANHLGLSGARALEVQALGVALLYSDPRLRAPSESIERNRRKQSDLWAYAISGDVPLVVVRVASTDQMEAVKQTIRAFGYWRLQGIDLDLVFLNEHPPSYQEGLQDLVTQAIQASPVRQGSMFRGQIQVLRAGQLPPEDLDLILAVARGVFGVDGLRLPAAEVDGMRQAYLRRRPGSQAPVEGGPASISSASSIHPSSDPLAAGNGFGGFANDGSYVIRTAEAGVVRPTPAPWINVVANLDGGFVASESGGGFSWSGNSQANRLSPWANDPVADRPSEVVYLRDETSGTYGSVTSAPAPRGGDYSAQHGFGFTTFTHADESLESRLTLFATEKDSLKAFILTVRNGSERRRELSAFHYHEWVLGVDRGESARHVVTERHDTHTALLARNRYHGEFAERVAFVQVLAPDDATLEWTADREAFIGRGCDVQDPIAVREGRALDGTTGAGYDPCCAWRVSFALDPREETRIVFVLGQAPGDDAVEALLARFTKVDDVAAELERVQASWDDRCGRIRVSSPSPAIDHALSGWLVYQTLSCRLWGRSALYQSGGAFGFRDQLQDVMALVWVDPTLARDQILLHAAHQFGEGDVLHWWHPPTGRGVRTRFSDDLLWLPFTTLHYLGATGDAAVLDEFVPFIAARLLQDDEDEVYLTPERSREVGDLYDHCCRAIDRSLEVGAHGLPLMGSGDWNDGMNRVGLDGGESVWLGFFLYDILSRFAPWCERRGEMDRAAAYRTHARELSVALNEAGWDGAWYRRAYYGDGSPLGSSTNVECRVDAIAQAWSILTGVAPADRASAALAAIESHLIDEDGRLIRLLTPPFDHAEKDPGYIAGYVPGVRENGAQYTHGVLWAVQAFAEAGDVERALELFEMISPLNHSGTREEAERYRVEPYVAVADVYSVPPHVGRGGWSWYTGSAAWMLRVALESILGFTLVDGDIRLRPRLPASWNEFEITYRPSPTTVYHVEVTRRLDEATAPEIAATLDGTRLDVTDGTLDVPVVDDGREHRVIVRL